MRLKCAKKIQTSIHEMCFQAYSSLLNGFYLSGSNPDVGYLLRLLFYRHKAFSVSFCKTYFLQRNLVDKRKVYCA